MALNIDGGDILEALGHSGFMLEKSNDGRRFKVKCSCGYECTWRQNVALAIEAGQHHLKLILREFKASGASRSTIVGTG